MTSAVVHAIEDGRLFMVTHPGEYIPVDISDGVLTDDFLPGEGKLYRLRYDEFPAQP